MDEEYTEKEEEHILRHPLVIERINQIKNQYKTFWLKKIDYIIEQLEEEHQDVLKNIVNNKKFPPIELKKYTNKIYEKNIGVVKTIKDGAK